MPVLGPGEGPRLTALGSTYTTKAAGDVSAGAYWLVEEEFWADTTPLHTHTAAEEAFYVLSGEVTAWMDGAETLLRPGAFLLVPRGTPHALRRVSDDAVRMLTLVTPAGLEEFFAAVVREGEEALLADPDRLVELAASYGTEIVGEYPAG
ncbi:cupin domain-containing protein [Blastococcus sp. CT_GayMR20]|uniref:cupin domain-containing protein n=1 Tax=Blastococcus sp. CT_GayMR20 TaxID=2559609 RepID=UPI0010743905|nr:cupin domain-containing protein [Blastococcus sp. CT_GayMR20]TFV86671.1 cupin domain-containing protein [Blastococcus sp. CT_GayMR20]